MTAERIMLIAGKRHIQVVVKYRLEKEGYHVLLAGDGVDALEQVKAEKPDLIILDLAMPGMDGFRFLEQMKGHAENGVVPVIVLAEYGSESNRVRSLELGAVEVVPKSFSPSGLVAAVWKILGASAKSKEPLTTKTQRHEEKN